MDGGFLLKEWEGLGLGVVVFFYRHYRDIFSSFGAANRR